MRLKIGLFLLFVCSISDSQNIKEFNLIGDWEVKNVTTHFPKVAKAQQEYINVLKDAFSDARFQFKKDKSFVINIAIEDISDQMKSAYWIFSSEKQQVIIVDRKDKDSKEPSWEWPITISKKGDQTFFVLMESQFVLQVVKK